VVTKDSLFSSTETVEDDVVVDDEGNEIFSSDMEMSSTPEDTGDIEVLASPPSIVGGETEDDAKMGSKVVVTPATSGTSSIFDEVVTSSTIE